MLWAAFWVAPRIEGRLESAVSEALSQRGFQVSSITAEGTSITVVGGPDAPDARLALAAAIRNVPGVSGVRSLLLTDEGDPPAGATRLAEADSRSGTVDPSGPATAAQPAPEEEGDRVPPDHGEKGPPTAAPEEAAQVPDEERETWSDEEASGRP
ncbi:MAG: hypothetical protein HKO53_20055, partial [Gemmatimonadetes bacterium]|nr:hypothetical protein [Gemmatimonadota bacterium]